MAETEKITVTVAQETLEWLEGEYPDGLSTQEKVRMAISDARQLNRDHDVYLVDDEGN
jgi:ABC-type thiamine transport system ATPase subunit